MALSLQQYTSRFTYSDSVTTILKKRMQRERKRKSLGVPLKNTGHSIPADLIIEILSWLPVKTLLQFRVVCKSWYTIIKSPHFISKHLKNYYSNNDDCGGCLIAQYSVTQAGELNVYELLIDYEGQRVLAYEEIRTPEYNTFMCGPCDGLYYLWCWYTGDKGRFLWNPALNELKLLPPITTKPDLPSHLTLVEGDCAHGFGYDPYTRDYKVIVIKGFEDTRKEESSSPLQSIFIYSLRNDRWRCWGDLTKMYYLNRHKCYVFVNGSVYWLASEEWCHETGSEFNLMISFHLATDEFQEWQVPKYEKPADDESLVVCHDSVALLVSYREENCFVMWTFHEGFWSKKCKVKFESENYRKPIGHWKENKLLFQVYGTLVLYDLLTQQTWYLESPGFCCQNISAYKESLVSVVDRRMWA